MFLPKELPNDNQKQNKKENLLHPIFLKDLIAEGRTDPRLVSGFVVIAGETQILGGGAHNVPRGPFVVVGVTTGAKVGVAEEREIVKQLDNIICLFLVCKRKCRILTLFKYFYSNFKQFYSSHKYNQDEK